MIVLVSLASWRCVPMGMRRPRVRLASEKISGDLIRDIRFGVWGVFYFIYSLGYVSNRPN